MRTSISFGRPGARARARRPRTDRARSIAGRRWAVNGAALVGCACALGSTLWGPWAGERAAFAHPEWSPVSANRYLKLDLVGEREVRLAYTVMFGAAPAWARRKRADANSDGQIDEAEAQAMGAELARAVRAGLALDLDGARVTPALEPPVVGLAGAQVSPEPYSVDLVARLAASGPGPHTLKLSDETVIEALGETEIRIEESPRSRVLAAFRGAPNEGAARPERERRFLFTGPKKTSLEDRSITVRWEGAAPAASPAPATVAPSGRSKLWVWGALALAASLAVVSRIKRR